MMTAMEANFRCDDVDGRPAQGGEKLSLLYLAPRPNHHHHPHRPDQDQHQDQHPPCSEHPHPARRPQTLPRAPPGAAPQPTRTRPAAASNIKTRRNGKLGRPLAAVSTVSERRRTEMRIRGFTAKLHRRPESNRNGRPGAGARSSASQVFQHTAHLKLVSHRSLWTSIALCVMLGWSSIPRVRIIVDRRVINRLRHGRHAIWQLEKTARLVEPIVASSCMISHDRELILDRSDS